jgi:hypothetical protein
VPPERARLGRVCARCGSTRAGAAPCEESSPSRIRTTLRSTVETAVSQRGGPKTGPNRVGDRSDGAGDTSEQVTRLAQRLAEINPDVVAALLRCFEPPGS